MAGATLDYRVPDEDLRPFVTLFYHFRAEIELLDDVERADHAQLRFRLDGGSADYMIAGGAPQRVRDCHVIGPTSGAIHTVATGPVEVIGMGLQAAGWAALIGLDASTMLDRAFDAAELFGEHWCGSAVARLLAAEGTDAKVALAASLVRAALARGDGATGVAAAVEAWLGASVAPEVEALVAATGLSPRQLERRVKALYGVPPKLLARKYRALRAAVSLASGTPIADVLTVGGFYDQSHLNREVKQFTGMTPRQMRATPSLLAQLTIGQRLALDGQVQTTISAT